MIRQIHEVLNLTRPLVGLDEETTGVNPKTSGIVELGLEIFIPGKPVKEYRTLINPLLPIPREATAIHGITNEMVRDAPTFVQLAANLFSGMSGCDFIGYNVRFDLRQLVEEFKRAGMEWSYEGARVIDGFRMWQLAEGRTLTDAVNHWLGSKHERSNDAELDLEMSALEESGKAHGALFDVKSSTRVVAAQLDQCPHLPRDLDALHELQWPGWYDADGKLRWIKGELCFTFGEHRDKPIRLAPKGYLNWVAGKDFSDKVKQTCRNAMRGIYPTPPTVTDVEDDDDPNSGLPA